MKEYFSRITIPDDDGDVFVEISEAVNHDFYVDITDKEGDSVKLNTDFAIRVCNAITKLIENVKGQNNV